MAQIAIEVNIFILLVRTEGLVGTSRWPPSGAGKNNHFLPPLPDKPLPAPSTGGGGCAAGNHKQTRRYCQAAPGYTDGDVTDIFHPQWLHYSIHANITAPDNHKKQYFSIICANNGAEKEIKATT